MPAAQVPGAQPTGRSSLLRRLGGLLRPAQARPGPDGPDVPDGPAAAARAAGGADAAPALSPSPGPGPRGGRAARGVRRLLTVSGWELWRQPRRLVRRVLLVDALCLALAGVGLAGTRLRLAEVATFLTFVGLAALAVLVSRRVAVPAAAGTGRAGQHDLLSTWTLPVAFVLPPVYAVAVHLPLCWMVRAHAPTQPLHRRIFEAASLGVAGFAAATVHLLLAPSPRPYSADSLAGTPRGVGALAGAVAAYTVVHRLLRVGLPGDTGTPPATRVTGRRRLWWRLAGRDAFFVESTEVCSSVVVAVLWSVNPMVLVIGTMPILLLQRSLLHAELVHAARTDPKTRLANAAYWREVAEREIARAARHGLPLSVLLVDIDHFKQINDRHGHLGGDIILLAVSDALRAAAGPRDLVGRFGGEEFVVLLTEVDLAGAAVIAEQIRGQVAGLRTRISDEPPVTVTVSIGVASTGVAPLGAASPGAVAADGPGRELAALLKLADAALYQAKADGRNRVRVAMPPTPAAIPAPPGQPEPAPPASPPSPPASSSAPSPAPAPASSPAPLPAATHSPSCPTQPSPVIQR